MQSINLQIAPGSVNPVINVSQNDVGRQFQLKLYDGAAAYTLPTGTTASIEGIKPDGHAFSYSDAVSVSGSILTVTTKLQMTVVAGRVICEIRLRKSGLDLGSLNFVMLVEESPINENVDPSDTEIPAIIELAEGQVEDAEAWARGTKNGEPVPSTAPQFQNNAQWYAEHVAASLDALSNVNISSLVNEDVLEYNSTTQKWKNSGAVRQLKQALSDEVTTRATVGAHNFMPNELTSQTYQDIVLQKNDDDTVNVTGSISSGQGAPTFVVCKDLLLHAGTYVLSGIPDNIQAGYGYVQAFVTSTAGADLQWADKGSDKSLATKTLSQDIHVKVYLIFYAANPQTFNFVYKPMISLASDPSTEFTSHAMTNRELTENKAEKSELASINITGTTNSTGAAISLGTFFYLNGSLVRAKISIANGATFTLNTNYENVTAGGLNALNENISMSSWNDMAIGAYRKSNKFVELNIYKALANSVTVSAWTSSDTLATISGYSNSYTAYVPFLFLTTGNVRKVGMFSVGTTGNIKIYNNSSESMTVMDMFAYALLRTDS